MKKVKASLPVEQTNQQQVHCDPSYMVCLESCDGHRFLIDRNCAMVSGVVQRAMQGKHCDGGCGLPQHAPCPIAADHGGAPNASPTPYTATLCTTPVDNATFTSTFASTSALSTASSEASMILGENLTVHVPQTDDNCSTTLIGSVRYNLFKLQEISGDLLDLAVQEMYHKYRYDSDPEKRPQESLHTAVEKHKFVALSVLLDM
ncbi:unnamed protein product [Trypanosoma congolense IL3000]|uniref:Uncharacterized protein TCIL3000_11_8040 n=1 Tax=Trypanosoma congolense (strain IL3000) TaxID=1068625 RepID=F9W4W9_TRYCI|nr:unnamed protein product [Trypanosoma congolense IL3000]CCD12216.1 unnamed protein product [Trypanosoma congolense IL3000]